MNGTLDAETERHLHRGLDLYNELKNSSGVIATAYTLSVFYIKADHQREAVDWFFYGVERTWATPGPREVNAGLMASIGLLDAFNKPVTTVVQALRGEWDVYDREIARFGPSGQRKGGSPLPARLIALRQAAARISRSRRWLALV